ncbi:MAG: peptidoglycan glycosyltransferase [Bryobacterales bacterium]|nr:peptidoglycan glycosyltransferase [Bryobacterales bacterium]
MTRPPVVAPDQEKQQQIAAAQQILRDDPKFASAKMAVFQYVTVGIFFVLIWSFWQLQVQQQEVYSEQAERNSIKSLPILAPRGKILDRDGRVIVDNHSSWTLLLSRETLKPEHLPAIASGLRLDLNDLNAKLARYRSRPKFEPLVLKEELTPEDLAFVESHRDPAFFPEMELIRAQRRLYPQNGMAAHVIGYTGEISDSELDNPDYANEEPGAVIGKFGLERRYNDLLKGVDGQRQVKVDNLGRERQILENKEAVPGKSLVTTLDLDLQAVAELALEGKKGSVVALDPRTGEILAMVSRPTFDPNKFAVRIKSADWKEIAQDPAKPLLNRAIQAQLAPGSTFKPIMAIAGLETGTIDDEWTAHCPGGASFYGHFYKCHQVHGTISLHRAIAQSCDTYFYNVGNKLGIDKMAFYADQAGFGHRTGVDLPGEAEGIVPSSAWKIRNFHVKWFAGETISVSIGQGALTVTPLQLASAIGGLSLGGVWHKPHLVLADTKKERPREWALNPANVKKVVDGMYGVVNEGGTGIRARIPGIEVCGKTGSAQTVSNDFVHSHGKAAMKDNSWFVGFAPRAAPEIVVAVLFEGGEHGMLAAPIARDVMKSYFDKKARLRMVTEKESKPAVAPQALQGGLKPAARGGRG